MASDCSHPLFARIYPRVDAFAQRHGGLAHRQELLEGLHGRVLEVGAGAGANFPHYPPEVEELIAVEPEPRLRAQAQRAAAGAACPVDVRPGAAEDLPLPGDRFDTVVVSLVLCSVRDPARALSEIRRVLRPGGQLRFYEHVRSERPGFARFQRVLDVVWPRMAAGCHLTRDTDAAIARSGLRIDQSRHFDFLINGRMTPSSPCVIGRATKP